MQFYAHAFICVKTIFWAIALHVLVINFMDCALYLCLMIGYKYEIRRIEMICNYYRHITVGKIFEH